MDILQKNELQTLMQQQKKVLENYRGNFGELNKYNKKIFAILEQNKLTAYDTETNDKKVAILAEIERGL